MLLLYPYPPAIHPFSVSIYIPLCFYFIYLCIILSYAFSAFTFHYASTLSITDKFLHTHSMNLHSTMLLLYQVLNNGFQCTHPIYIPLCFYFISPSGGSLLPVCAFTFHYASTLSGVPAAEKTTEGNIYIPLCFYFI